MLVVGGAPEERKGRGIKKGNQNSGAVCVLRGVLLGPVTGTFAYQKPMQAQAIQARMCLVEQRHDLD